ncbi:MAG: DUF4214 domain-containing protein [Roseburia sp.]
MKAKRKILALLLCISMLLSICPQTAFAAVTPGSMPVVYTDDTYTGGSGVSDGSKERPFRYFQDALDAVAERGTIYVLSGGAWHNDTSGVGKPLVISKAITITTDDGNGRPNSSYDLNTRSGSLVLEADVTFKDITLTPTNTSQWKGIFANGHTLILENVKKSNSVMSVLDIYAGGFAGYTGNEGDDGQVIISGSETKIGNVYAGGYGETCLYSTYISLTGPETVIGTVYGGNNMGSSLTDTGGDVSIYLENSNVKTVDGCGSMASVWFSSNRRKSTSFSNVTSLDISGLLAPASLAQVNTITLGSDGILDLSNTVKTQSAYTVHNFYSEVDNKTNQCGTLRMKQTDSLTITESLTGEANFQTTDNMPVSGATSGTVTPNHVYIDASGALVKTGTFRFAPNQNTYEQASMQLVNDGGRWMAKVGQVQPVSYTITASAGAGGSISPAGNVSVSRGGSKTFTITPLSGYELERVTVDGRDVTGQIFGGQYTFANVQQAHSIYAAFRRIQQPVPKYYSVSVSQSEAAGGTVSGGGTYRENTYVTVTAVANSDYKFVRWMENGNEVSNQASYSFPASANRALVAVFEKEKPGTEWMEGYEGKQKFAALLYGNALGREADASEVGYWEEQLSGGREGAEVAYGFLFSEEFKNHNYDNPEYVEHLYLCLMGRPSDAGGKAGWVAHLDNGVSRVYVFKQFIDSSEFDNLCNTYGISRGTVALTEARDQNYDVARFVSRNYTQFLGRDYDEQGLNDWCGKINSRTQTMQEIAFGFVFSAECENKNLSDREFVEMLYRGCFDREGDAEGVNGWVGDLGSGAKNRMDVFFGFANSQEFFNMVQSYGL